MGEDGSEHDKHTINKTVFWLFLSIGIILTLLFLSGQTFSLIDYDMTVSLGLQESVEEVGEVGIAWANGFAFADTILYIPLLIIGIIGLLKRMDWGLYSMFAAMAITVYWRSSVWQPSSLAGILSI
ncbi:hypothetical protein [Methanolobus profundi]|uniref:Uncharacterized protein n=1 Tax=Methanolobus profundi TaxID=487685 RepID=A0A1I4PNN8_9EURY|nr:hypothetical protein [Methanolobus profundi]SFM29348.1 hypothetical protein SAMN04488696_0789 [Methanolobus profundi]